MPPDFFRTLASALHRDGLDVVLVGGWAVNEHGFHRFTRDIDFTFVASRKDELLRRLATLGYTPVTDSPLVTRLQFRDVLVPEIDVLWVDAQTQDKLITSSVPMNSLPQMKVIGLRDLLAMKLHALKQDKERSEKDLLDIITLMKHNPEAPDPTTFKELCDNFGPPKIFDDFTIKWNL